MRHNFCTSPPVKSLALGMIVTTLGRFLVAIAGSLERGLTTRRRARLGAVAVAVITGLADPDTALTMGAEKDSISCQRRIP